MSRAACSSSAPTRNGPTNDKVFDRDKTVLVYCASGGRSALAGKTLQDPGYKDVRNLGGFKDWVEYGGAVEKVYRPAITEAAIAASP